MTETPNSASLGPEHAWYTPPGNGVTRVVPSLSLLTPGVGIQETIEKSQLLRDPRSHFLTIAF